MGICKTAQVLLLAATCVGCTGTRSTASGPEGASAAVPVQVVRDGSRYRLLRGGQPYEIKGAGIEFGDIAAFAAHGGTSFRTWRTNNGTSTGRQVLDEAARRGLTVVMCIEIGRERRGFNYNDKAAVQRQLRFARREVLKYKDHPALLAWMIGNEPNLKFRNPKVFDAINDISRMIHEVDGKHPTTTALAGFDAKLAGLVQSRAPDLDFISIQMYGDIVNLQRKLAQAGYEKPYFVTEWGTIGHWEVDKTSWGAPIEPNSSEKARNYRKGYDEGIAPDKERMLGAFAFLWGQAQERTPTWYGMFLADGSETEAVDVMHHIWNGKWPANRAPQVAGMTFDGRVAEQNVVVAPGARHAAHLAASDPDGDTLAYSWEIREDPVRKEEGGDREPVPRRVTVPIEGATGGSPVVTAPRKPGRYRLFVYVHDGKGHAGHANIPFLVARPR